MNLGLSLENDKNISPSNIRKRSAEIAKTYEVEIEMQYNGKRGRIDAAAAEEASRQFSDTDVDSDREQPLEWQPSTIV